MPWLCEEALRMMVELRDELDRVFSSVPDRGEPVEPTGKQRRTAKDKAS